MIFRAALFALVCCFTFLNFIEAQSLTFDSAFANNGVFIEDFGFHDNLMDVKLQPDQKIICTGTSLSTGYLGELRLIRLNADGTLDSSFASNGVFSFAATNETYGIESYVCSDGKIIVSGLASLTFGYYDFLVLRLNPDGSMDSTFGNNGSTVVSFSSRDDLTQAMNVMADGRIIISGTITDTVNYYHNPCMIRFTENGQLDSSFGNNGIYFYPALHFDNELNAVVIQSDGKIVAAGHYSPVFTGAMNFDILLIRVDSNGLPDASFGSNGVVITPVNGGIDDCFGMEMDTAGNFILCGFTTQPFTLDLDMILMKYNETGSLDSTFGINGLVTFNNAPEDVAYDVLIQSDNKIVACGSSGLSFFGPRSFALWRYMPDGTPDATFGNNGFDTIIITTTFQDFNSLALQADGKLVAGGKFQNTTLTNNDVTVIRFQNQVASTVSEHGIDRPINLFPNPVAKNQIVTLQFDRIIQSPMKISTIDIFGKKIIISVGVITTGNQLSFQLPQSIKSGMYCLVIESDDLKLTHKLIVH